MSCMNLEHPGVFYWLIEIVQRPSAHSMVHFSRHIRLLRKYNCQKELVTGTKNFYRRHWIVTNPWNVCSCNAKITVVYEDVHCSISAMHDADSISTGQSFQRRAITVEYSRTILEHLRPPHQPRGFRLEVNSWSRKSGSYAGIVHGGRRQPNEKWTRPHGTYRLNFHLNEQIWKKCPRFVRTTGTLCGHLNVTA